ncbi:hypothetical protein AM500_10980 [Bacillus sp. FJAT-18017]|uniref:hypothetical protein n=1 Tax=Bacillus sp. FJAT-18017 TaxID=1705566 RepID=UPI0006AEFC59|nr:hypothetical protein [Bacillus sp. FJAT-18017]ALC90248.1 hypothetical protein AM500_10980 [Bacillus sp. FJAT-18017]
MELYGLEYEDMAFTNLRFIRKDTICNTVYLTFKDYLTEEVLTFDFDKIMNIKPCFRIDLLQGYYTEPLADTPRHSLY